MIGAPLTLRFFVATGTAALLVSCSSGDDSSSGAGEPEQTTPSAQSSPTQDIARQDYLDAVNALCDALLPKVIDATHGGSTDVPAKEWVATWPAHKALLDGFDEDLAEIDVPASADGAAQVMADYVAWATTIDEARITAAQQGEDAWRAELTAEVGIEDAPTLVALVPAGFSDSCQAR